MSNRHSKQPTAKRCLHRPTFVSRTRNSFFCHNLHNPGTFLEVYMRHRCSLGRSRMPLLGSTNKPIPNIVGTPKQEDNRQKGSRDDNGIDCKPNIDLILLVKLVRESSLAHSAITSGKPLDSAASKGEDRSPCSGHSYKESGSSSFR